MICSSLTSGCGSQGVGAPFSPGTLVGKGWGRDTEKGRVVRCVVERKMVRPCLELPPEEIVLIRQPAGLPVEGSGHSPARARARPVPSAAAPACGSAQVLAG